MSKYLDNLTKEQTTDLCKRFGLSVKESIIAKAKECDSKTYKTTLKNANLYAVTAGFGLFLHILQYRIKNNIYPA